MKEIVSTRSVRSRRRVRFTNINEILEEGRRLSTAQIDLLGNWSLGQILDHLACWMDFSIDGVPVKVPWLARLVMRPLRSIMLNRPLPAGFRWQGESAKRALPQAEVSTPSGLAHLERAVQRLNATEKRADSPLLGPLTRAEWDKLHMRHAELHLSFVVPR